DAYKAMAAFVDGENAGATSANPYCTSLVLTDKYVEDAEEFIGQEFDVKVTRIDQRRNRAVFSHKVIAQEEKQQRLDAIWNTLSEGDIVEGKVMRFTDYGAFVDLGGIDGLLHISEISWGKLKHPQEVLSIGDTIRVKILGMNREKGKISLGLKQCTPEPWTVIYDKYQVGQEVEGKVVQIKEYGAFVELEPGLDGLVHISEVAHKRVKDIAEELQLGQTVKAKILDIDPERKRISLSIKQTTEPEEELDEEVAEEEAPEVEEPAVEEAVQEEKTEEVEE
ncbi:MAG: S1 RNA-binding domain-containing protein, partial [Firmicutes bacterium]|nr:S1 RNA-binding domain-containing protein [Bacillota bacterium]